MKLSLIIPVLNEEANVQTLVQAVDTAFAGARDIELELVFVDDGSRDRTFDLLSEQSGRDPRIHVVRLSRNFGSHAALLAGFEHCGGDAAAYLAADLQDPPETIRLMVEHWRSGSLVVWGQRQQRDDPPANKLFALLYYRLMRRFALPDMPRGGLDICLIDRKVINAIVAMREKNTAIFGLILWAGFPQTFVPYERRSRERGRSRWTIAKKIKLVVDSFVAFSFFPIRLVTYLGGIFSMLGFAYGLFTVLRVLLSGSAVQGWPTLVTLIVTLSGVQLLMLGIVAEYLWRTFDEARGRPPYLVRDLVGFTEGSRPASPDASKP